MASRRSKTIRNAARPAASRLSEILRAGAELDSTQEALLDERGEAIYRRHEARLERAHKGGVAAIEIESGKIYLGESLGEAAEKALAKHPGRVFYFRVIGIVSRSRFAGSKQ